MWRCGLRIDEGCVVVDSSIAIDIGVEKYVKWLFRVSHSTAVYVAVEPMIITTRINNKLQSFAVGPGSAILCGIEPLKQPFETIYKIAEPCWGDAMMLIPYTSTPLSCSKAKQLGFDVDFDEAIGIPHICIAKGSWTELKQILGGGIAEVDRYSREISGTLKIAVRNTLFFILAKGLLKELKFENVMAKLLDMYFDYDSQVYLEELAKINEDVAIYGFGKGLITRFSDLGEVTSIIYSLALLVAHLVDVNNAKAVAYKMKLL